MSDSEPGSPRHEPNIVAPDPEDTVKILLATDNHIGYMERDPIRGQDSINTFREILQLAVKHDVDYILLAGDLFHENKPSRECLYQTMALLREYTLGEKPIQVELLSDPDEGKADGFSFPAVNYEDPNLNVSIPVFSIHGNHDDPQGTGTSGALCALDILSVSGLLNYMGKFDLPVSDKEASNTGIAIRPVLLRKGETKIGMYGVGNVKDARMHFELRSNRVRMYMPKDKNKWFNILLVHQNRVKHGPQEFVPEGMFDDSVDLVVWGHEHDCRIVPEPVAGKNYYITQPGSSVATSLADGEAIEKHVALLQIQGKEFQLTPLPLKTVRPFVIKDVDLQEAAEEDGLDLNDQMEITKYLKVKVNELIAKANDQWKERNEKAIAAGEPPLEKMLPLVRLKVDTTGVTETSNPIRFGQEFQGRIANPRDLLVFHRAKKAGGKRGAGKVVMDEPELSIDNPDLSVSEKLAKVRVATLVREYLSAQELQLLGEYGMSDAIQLFVEKDDTHAIQTHVSASLKELLSDVKTKEGVEDADEDDLVEILVKAKEAQEKQYLEERETGQLGNKGKGKEKEGDDDSDASRDSMEEEFDPRKYQNAEDDDMDFDDTPAPKKKAPAASRSRAAAATSKAPAAKKAPAKKTAAPKARGKKAAPPPSDDDDDDDVIELDDDDEEEEAPPKPVKRTNRAAVLSQKPAAAPKKKAAAKKAAAGSSRGATQTQLSFAPAGRSSRVAATKAKSKMVISDDDFDDDD